MTVSIVTSQTVLKAQSGKINSVHVSVAGAAGTINDCATTGAVAASNEILATPATLGYSFTPHVPLVFATGLVVSPGAGQQVTVDWE